MNNDVSPPPVLMQAQPASVPADVTQALAELRTACANWNSSSIQTADATACDVALNRHADAYNGVFFGVTATLLTVFYVHGCRAAVRAETMSQWEDRVAYGLCAFMGGISGLFLVGLDLALSIAPLAGRGLRVLEAACVVVGAVTLPVGRWFHRREVRCLAIKGC